MFWDRVNVFLSAFLCACFEDSTLYVVLATAFRLKKTERMKERKNVQKIYLFSNFGLRLKTDFWNVVARIDKIWIHLWQTDKEQKVFFEETSCSYDIFPYKNNCPPCNLLNFIVFNQILFLSDFKVMCFHISKPCYKNWSVLCGAKRSSILWHKL